MPAGEYPELHENYPGLTARVMNVESRAVVASWPLRRRILLRIAVSLGEPPGSASEHGSGCNEILLIETVVTDYDEPLFRLVDEPAETFDPAARRTAATVPLLRF